MLRDSLTEVTNWLTLLIELRIASRTEERTNCVFESMIYFEYTIDKESAGIKNTGRCRRLLEIHAIRADNVCTVTPVLASACAGPNP